MGNKDEKILSVLMEGENPIDLQLELFLYLDNLYRSSGGDGLEITNRGYYRRVSKGESPYDVYKGTQVENKHFRIEPSMVTGHVSRDDVYTAVQKLIKPPKREKVRKALDKKFPSSVWEDKFPRIEVIRYLFSEHRACFVY